MAKTFGTGADPKGLVNRGVEGSGAAQIFRPSQAAQDFVTRQARGEQQRVAQKRAEAKAKVEKQKEIDKYAIDADVATFMQKDNEEALARLGALEGKLANLKVMGIDPRNDIEFKKEEYAFKQYISNLKNEKDAYEKGVTNFIAISKDPNYDIEQINDFATRLEVFRQSPSGQRFEVDTNPPQKPLKIDLFKELKNIDIGYFTQADIDAETGLGEKSKTVVKDKLKSQSESLVNAKPKVYEYGINQGLWTNKEEAADWFYLNKLYQADTSKEDIVRTTSKSNMFGTGSSSKEIEEDFNKWKQDFKNGDENAASFLFNIQLPTGTKIEGFKVAPTVEQEQGYAAEGFAPRIKYMFKAAKMVDGQKLTENLEIEPLIEDDTQLYKYYISAVKDKNRTYGKDVAERTSKTKVIQDKPKAEPNTPKTPSATKKPKPY
jgi:hypothetical protein